MAQAAARMPEFDGTHAKFAEAYRAFKARMKLFLDDQTITAAPKQAIKIKIAIGDEGMRRLLSSSLTDAEKDPEKLWPFRKNFGHIKC